MLEQHKVGTLRQHDDAMVPHSPNILLVNDGSSLPNNCLVYRHCEAQSLAKAFDAARQRQSRTQDRQDETLTQSGSHMRTKSSSSTTEDRNCLLPRRRRHSFGHCRQYCWPSLAWSWL